MATQARSIASLTISFGLVAIPVKLYSATVSSERISFNLLRQKDGSRVKPEFGSVWYHYMGPDKDHARTHMTIAVPGATTQSLGLPDNGKNGTVWIMNAGTSTAHLMTPGE